MIARIVNLLLGLALAATACWEPRGSTVFWHDLVIGLTVAGVALVAMAVRGVNFLNTALALWMFFSGLIMPVVPHVYVGIISGALIFTFSLVSSDDRTFWPVRRRDPARVPQRG